MRAGRRRGETRRVDEMPRANARPTRTGGLWDPADEYTMLSLASESPDGVLPERDKPTSYRRTDGCTERAKQRRPKKPETAAVPAGGNSSLVP